MCKGMTKLSLITILSANLMAEVLFDPDYAKIGIQFRQAEAIPYSHYRIVHRKPHRIKRQKKGYYVGAGVSATAVIPNPKCDKADNQKDNGVSAQLKVGKKMNNNLEVEARISKTIISKKAKLTTVSVVAKPKVRITRSVSVYGTAGAAHTTQESPEFRKIKALGVTVGGGVEIQNSENVRTTIDYQDLYMGSENDAPEMDAVTVGVDLEL